MPGGGRDVVAVARIIAAQRPVGALDDALGALDDPVERRAQDFVERVVEIAGPRSPGLDRRRPEPRRCRESRRSCRRRRSPLRRSSTTERDFVAAAAGALAGEAAPRRKRADQRHFAVVILLEPEDAGQRLARRLRRARFRAARQDRPTARSGAAPRRRPIRGAPPRPPLRSRRRAASEARPGGRATVQPSSDKAISSPSGVARTHSSMSWSADAAMRRARDRRCQARAQAARPPQPAAAPASCPDRRAGLALQRLELGVGGDQPAGLVDPAEDRARFRGCARHGSFPRRRARRGRPVGVASHVARLADLLVAHAVEYADRRARIIDPEQVADAREQPGAQARGSRRPTRNRAIIRRGSAESSSSIATSPRIPARRARTWATNADLAFMRRGEDQIVGRARHSRRAGGPSVAVSASMLRAGSCARGERAGAHAAVRFRDAAAAASSTRSAAAIDVDQRLGGRRRDRRMRRRHWPKRSRRRPRARISAIAAAETAPSAWLTRPWRTRASRRPVRARGGGRDPLLVGAAQQHRHQARLVEQPRRAQLLDQSRDCPRRWRPPSARQRRPKRIRDIADQAMEHRGHQRALLLGQALCGIEEEIGADRGQPVAARAARGRVRSAAEAAIGHSSGIITPALIEFPLTSRQLGGECRTCWTMKKDSAA